MYVIVMSVNAIFVNLSQTVLMMLISNRFTQQLLVPAAVQADQDL